jgi:hypothetical protein
MIGNNKLKLNQSTMIEAVQLLLNSEYREGLAPKVTKIDTEKTNNTIIFVVEVKSKYEKEEENVKPTPSLLAINEHD